MKKEFTKSEIVGFDLYVDTFIACRSKVVGILDFLLEMKVLSLKEREVLYLRLVDWNSIENCGKRFGITRERVRQIEAKAREKIRMFARGEYDDFIVREYGKSLPQTCLWLRRKGYAELADLLAPNKL